jgi:HAD superfamily hydrolase (TIGR01458 family)
MKALLLDMDGVLYNSETPIEGAADTLAWIRQEKIPHLFVTNTTSRGRAVLAEKLAQFGIPAAPEEIWTPCAAALEHLRSGGEIALFVPAKARTEFEGLPCLPDTAEEGARWVVIGDLGQGWSFGALNRAFRLLHSNPEAKLVALGMTRFWQSGDGLRLDAGPFAAALQYATGKEPLVLGKPAAAFFQAAVAKLGFSPAEVLMIGDDVLIDVAGAQQAGLKGALVRTGKFRPADLEVGVQPDAVLGSIRDLPEWWSHRTRDSIN